jgi:hypothetical protein
LAASSAGLLALCWSLAAHPLPPPTSTSSLLRIDREKICVTNGIVSALPDGRLKIDSPSSRAFVRIPTSQTAEIRFRYLGPSVGSKPLASGEMRRQIGLKLRAQDTCNLLYAMWHIERDSRIAVSVKRNVGEHTHEECDARGYVNVKPRSSVDVPRIRPGESHTLRADLRGAHLTVAADGRVVWEGTVGPEINGIEGPVGLRTDNARFEFEYYAGGDGEVPSGTISGQLTRCVQSAGD